MGSAAVSDRNNRPLLRSWLSAAAQYSRASDDANAGIEPESRCTTSSWQAAPYWPAPLMQSYFAAADWPAPRLPVLHVDVAYMAS